MVDVGLMAGNFYSIMVVVLSKSLTYCTLTKGIVFVRDTKTTDTHTGSWIEGKEIYKEEDPSTI